MVSSLEDIERKRKRMEHEDTWYDYKSALNLRHPDSVPIAEKYHGQHSKEELQRLYFLS